jgi:outer membrane protein TolC
MYERQPFYQLNAVERNLATSEADFDKAREKFNETLLDILQKL